MCDANTSDEDKIMLGGIYIKIYETPIDLETKNDIWSDVNGLHEHMITKIRDHLIDTEKNIHEKILAIDKMNEDRKNIPIIFSQIVLLRQIMNTLFNKMWNKYSNKICNINYFTLASKTPYMLRKDIVNEHDGSKFALAIIHDVDQTIIFPKELCLLYIKLNDKFHPKTKPIHNSIQQLTDLKKILINSNEPLLTSLGISENIIVQLINQVNENSQLF
jgi:hypothetical protein